MKHKANIIADDLVDWIDSLLPEFDLEGTARARGALKRARKIKDAKALLRLALTRAMCGLSLRETAAWSGSLSDVAVLKRLRGAGDWLCEICEALLARHLKGSQGRCFAGRQVRLVDGSVIAAPGGAPDWRLHLSLSLPEMKIADLCLTQRSVAESFKRLAVAAGDLYVADRGYARAPDLEHLLACNADFLVRCGARSLRFLSPQGEALNLAALLSACRPGQTLDREVLVAVGRDRSFGARLLARPLPEEQAAEARRKQRLGARREGYTPSHQAQVVAGYAVLLTSITSDQASAENLFTLYRLRWQVELLFKRLKSILAIKALADRHREAARTWLYSVLIAALLMEKITPKLAESFP